MIQDKIVLYKETKRPQPQKQTQNKWPIPYKTQLTETLRQLAIKEAITEGIKPNKVFVDKINPNKTIKILKFLPLQECLLTGDDSTNFNFIQAEVKNSTTHVTSIYTINEILWIYDV